MYRDHRKTSFYGFVLGLMLLWLSYHNFDTVNNKKTSVDRRDNDYFRYITTLVLKRRKAKWQTYVLVHGHHSLLNQVEEHMY